MMLALVAGADVVKAWQVDRGREREEPFMRLRGGRCGDCSMQTALERAFGSVTSATSVVFPFRRG